jgi:hypothetical protein
MAKGTYRMSINGFYCLAETWDDALNWDGQHDEVYFRVNTKTIKKDGTVLATSDDASMVLGDVRGFTGRLQVGTARDWLGSATGGITSGDTYPTPTPWLRSVDLDLKEVADARRFPPYTIWEGELSDGDEQAVFVTPTLWEWDPGQGAIDGWIQWQKDTDAKFGSRAKEVFGGIWPVSRPFFDAVSLGIQTFATLSGLWSPAGKSMQRPIGLQRDPNDPNGSVFNPTIFALTYDTAEYLFNNNLTGNGKGVVGIRYTDDSYLRGDYNIYVELDKLGASPRFPDASVVRETSAPEVYVIFGGAKFWVPDPTILAQWYGGWAAVRVVSDGTLKDEGIGDTPVDNTLLKEITAPTVWRIENGEKRWVVSPTVLARYGGWSAVRTVPDGTTTRFPQGPDLAA